MKKMFETIKVVVLEIHREIDIYLTIQRYHRNSRKARVRELE